MFEQVVNPSMQPSTGLFAEKVMIDVKGCGRRVAGLEHATFCGPARPACKQANLQRLLLVSCEYHAYGDIHWRMQSLNKLK